MNIQDKIIREHRETLMQLQRQDDERQNLNEVMREWEGRYHELQQEKKMEANERQKSEDQELIDISTLRKEAASLRSELAENGDRNDTLYQDILKISRSEEEVNRDHLSFKQQLQDTNHEVDTHEEQIEHFKRAVETLNQEREESRQEMQKLKQMELDLIDEHLQQQSFKKELESKMKQFILKLQAIEEKVLEQDQELEPNVKKVSILNEKLDQLEEQVTVENKELKHLDEDHKFVTKQCDDLAKDIEYLINEGNTLEKKLAEFDTNYGEADQELSALMKDNDKLDDDCHILQQTFETLLTKRSDLQNQNEALNEEHQILKLELEDFLKLTDTISELIEKKRVRTRLINDKKRDLSASISTKVIHSEEIIDLGNKNQYAPRQPRQHQRKRSSTDFDDLRVQIRGDRQQMSQTYHQKPTNLTDSRSQLTRPPPPMMMKEFQKFKYDKPGHVERTSSTIPTMQSKRGASYDEWMQDRAAQRTSATRNVTFPEERVANFPSGRMFRTTAQNTTYMQQMHSPEFNQLQQDGGGQMSKFQNYDAKESIRNYQIGSQTNINSAAYPLRGALSSNKKDKLYAEMKKREDQRQSIQKEEKTQITSLERHADIKNRDQQRQSSKNNEIVTFSTVERSTVDLGNTLDKNERQNAQSPLRQSPILKQETKRSTSQAVNNSEKKTTVIREGAESQSYIEYQSQPMYQSYSAKKNPGKRFDGGFQEQEMTDVLNDYRSGPEEGRKSVGAKGSRKSGGQSNKSFGRSSGKRAKGSILDTYAQVSEGSQNVSLGKKK